MYTTLFSKNYFLKIDFCLKTLYFFLYWLLIFDKFFIIGFFINYVFGYHRSSFQRLLRCRFFCDSMACCLVCYCIISKRNKKTIQNYSKQTNIVCITIIQRYVINIFYKKKQSDSNFVWQHGGFLVLTLINIPQQNHIT